jgi:hypothetical protein
MRARVRIMRTKTMRTKTMRTKTMRTKAGIFTLSALCAALLTAPAFAGNSPGLTPGEADKEKIDKSLGKAPKGKAPTFLVAAL